MKFEPAVPDGTVERTDWSDPGGQGIPPPLRDRLSTLHAQTLGKRADAFVTLTIAELRWLLVFVLDTEFTVGRLRLDLDSDAARTREQHTALEQRVGLLEAAQGRVS